VTFTEDDGPFAAHGAPVIGVADIDGAAPDHGALADGWEESMLVVLGGFIGLGWDPM